MYCTLSCAGGWAAPWTGLSLPTCDLTWSDEYIGYREEWNNCLSDM